jgi:uncharacterized protein (TIGR02391 family)
MDIEKLLHPRLIETCLPLIEQGHYKHAAREAMTQVEIALKEKCLAPKDKKRFGRRLIKEAFGGKSPILFIPLSDDLQEEAGNFFDSCFEYYRNYAHHDGSNFDQENTLRLLIIASELLDLIGSSKRSFIGIGGVEGLVKTKLFDSPEEVKTFLQFIDGQTIVDDVVDGFYEDMYGRGFDDEQLKIVFELGLVEGTSESVADELEMVDIYSFILTDMGKAVLRGERVT